MGLLMSHSRLASLLPLTMASVLAASAAPVRGADLGFEQYLKHHHSETIILPRLYEPVPKHVPTVTDRELIRLWEGPGSPILRDANMEKQLYEAVVAWRDRNPVRFDHHHPTVGHLITDRQFFDYAMYLYHLDTARFVHYHHHLIPFLRGMAMVLMTPHSPGTAPQTIAPTVPVGPPAAESITNTPMPPTPPESLSVPEPASLVTLALGIGLLGAGVWARRRAGQAVGSNEALPLPDRL
jgi:hypothetical protein